MEKAKLFLNRLLRSGSEISALLAVMVFPFLLNLVIALIPASDKTSAIQGKIVPSEMLAYCVSLIAPLFLFFLRSHGKNFAVYALKPMFLIALGVYFLAVTLILIAKNGFVNGIDLNGGHLDGYFWTSAGALFIAIFLRFYTEYQNSLFSDYKSTVDRDQEAFNNRFRNSI